MSNMANSGSTPEEMTGEVQAESKIDAAALIRECLNKVIELLNLGEIALAERCLSDLIRHYVGRPDATLFRLFQLTPDASLAPKLNEFKDAVESMQNELLQVCFTTIVGPWGIDELTSVEQQTREQAYVRLADSIDVGKRIPLFEDKSDDLLFIGFNIPLKICNYRCSYCYLNFDLKPDMERLAELPKIIDRLALIPRPIAVRFMPWGDIIAIPKMWPYFKQLAALPNLRFVEFWSNLSRPLDGILENFPVSKLAVVTTYHPGAMRDIDKDKKAYFERVKFLRDNAHDVICLLVASPDNAPFIAEAKKICDGMGVPITIKPLQGVYKPTGQEFPQAYSHADLAKMIKWRGNDITMHFMMGHRTNLRCSAGRDLISICHDGAVSRCAPADFASRCDQKLGNMLDEKGPMVEKANRYCWQGGCECGDIVSFSEPFMAEFRREGASIHKLKRAPGQLGLRSYDKV